MKVVALSSTDENPSIVVMVGTRTSRIAPHATDSLLSLLGPSESQGVQMSLEGSIAML